jgi:hypothetical protein
VSRGSRDQDLPRTLVVAVQRPLPPAAARCLESDHLNGGSTPETCRIANANKSANADVPSEAPTSLL